MARRLQLHEKLCEILGTRNVYFQPPESLKIKYPAIIYRVANREDLRADDRRYRDYVAYDGIFITRDPDDTTMDDLLDGFTYIYTSAKPYTVDNLHHNPFTLHF